MKIENTFTGSNINMNFSDINLPMDNCVKLPEQTGSSSTSYLNTARLMNQPCFNAKQTTTKENNKFNYKKMIEEIDSDDPINLNDDEINQSLNEIKLNQRQTLLNNANHVHCHDSTMDNILREQSKKAINKLMIGLIICTIFMFVELIGGYLSDSLAIFTGKLNSS